MALTVIPPKGSSYDAQDAAVRELQGLRVAVLAGAASSTKINVAAIRLEDTVLSCVEYEAGVPVDRTSVTTIAPTKATGTVTCSAVDAADTLTLNGRVYTFVANGVVPNKLADQVEVGTTNTITATNLAAQINLTSGNLVTATSATNVVTLIANAEGTAGNSITTVGNDADLTCSGATLAGGTATGGVLIADTTTGNAVVLMWYNKR